MILLVTYDLKGPSTQYGRLYDYLKNHTWWHYLGSAWLLATDKSPDTVTNDMSKLIGKDDRFLVVKFDKPYQGWLPKDAWEWIHKHQS